ncbi:hypothetical protein KC19_3G028400 [Ceratodon purpureus]|uniref:Uncharacterized protein n=1 Tax=Ceratodon purpureus TaxID=3225 RepID=A0A8T0IGM7_CERPU|nr:hypothetical protein KC19_3G028400 [Ceratodon purpureus]
MAMRLELLQYQASQYASPSAARPRPTVSRRGSQTACCLPPLRNLNQQHAKTANSLHHSPQICSFFNTNSLFKLRPRDIHGRENTKCSFVTQASARGGNGWDQGDGSDFKQPSPKEESGGIMSFVASLVKKVIKLAGIMLILSTLFAAAAPTILSSSRGLKTIMSLASYTIPGTVSVAHASLGWNKPVHLEGITLKGIDGETVVSIPKIETRASLWSIVRGKTGFGDATVTAPVVNLQQDPESGQPHLALALTPLSKLQASNPNPNKNKKRPVATQPPKDVSLTATLKAPRGSLEVVKGKVVLPQDAATAIGPSIFLDVAAGRFATEGNDALEAATHEYRGKVPIRANLYSDRAQFEALGFLGLARGQIQLLRPLKAEMDLTPELGKLYLAQVNPLLGEIIGPAIGEDDLPDVTLYVAPANFRLPSDEYSIRIEPMRTTLAKGQLVDGVLNLLSRQDLLKGRSQITALTSPIEANINLKTGVVACDRIDLLLADRVHVATWGVVNIHHETVQMTLAIPGATLRETLGLTRLAHDYYLKIPIRGSMERPQVDFMAAGKGIAQLTLQQQTGSAGQLFSSFFQQSDKETSASEVPKPIDVLPWDNRS